MNQSNQDMGMDNRITGRYYIKQRQPIVLMLGVCRENKMTETE